MNILIVDDDETMRSGTARRITSMQFPEIEDVACAASGEEALALLQERPFDVMFTDIRMAELNGLSLIEQARTLHPQLICVIITAYDQFQYAQQAIRLGVEDFLVKPLSLDTMRQKVRAVIDKHLAMTNQKEARLELEICGQLLSGSRTLGECFAQCGFPPPPEPLCMALWPREGGQPGDWRELDGCFTWTSRSHAFLLTAWDGGQATERLCAAARRTGLYIGVSQPGVSLPTLSAQASDALSFAWMERQPTALLWTPQEAGYLSDTHRRLLAQLRELHADSVRALLTDALAHVPPEGRRAAGQLVESAAEELAQLRASKALPPSEPFALTPGQGTQRVVARLYEETQALSRAAASTEQLHPVAYAKQYVKEHLCEPIDMAVVANRLNLSYAYFSRVFREETGTTFSDYVLELRMQEVCRLLLQGEKLVTIAQRLGYQNAANLTRAFTRRFGVSPKRWLAQHRGRMQGEA